MVGGVRPRRATRSSSGEHGIGRASDAVDEDDDIRARPCGGSDARSAVGRATSGWTTPLRVRGCARGMEASDAAALASRLGLGLDEGRRRVVGGAGRSRGIDPSVQEGLDQRLRSRRDTVIGTGRRDNETSRRNRRQRCCLCCEMRAVETSGLGFVRRRGLRRRRRLRERTDLPGGDRSLGDLPRSRALGLVE